MDRGVTRLLAAMPARPRAEFCARWTGTERADPAALLHALRDPALVAERAGRLAPGPRALLARIVAEPGATLLRAEVDAGGITAAAAAAALQREGFLLAAAAHEWTTYGEACWIVPAELVATLHSVSVRARTRPPLRRGVAPAAAALARLGPQAADAWRRLVAGDGLAAAEAMPGAACQALAGIGLVQELDLPARRLGLELPERAVVAAPAALWQTLPWPDPPPTPDPGTGLGDLATAARELVWLAAEEGVPLPRRQQPEAEWLGAVAGRLGLTAAGSRHGPRDLRWLLGLVRARGLLTPGEGALRATADGEAFAAASVAVRSRALLAAARREPARAAGPFAPGLRRRALAWLRRVPRDGCVPLRTLAAVAVAGTLLAAARSARATAWVGGLATHADLLAAVEGFVLGRLVPLGLVWAMGERASCRVAWTELGAAVAGGGAPGARPARVVVNGDLEVFVFPGAGRAACADRLAAFAPRRGTGRVLRHRLDLDGLRRAARRGVPAGAVRAVLGELSGAPLPPEAEALLVEAARACAGTAAGAIFAP